MLLNDEDSVVREREPNGVMPADGVRLGPWDVPTEQVHQQLIGPARLTTSALPSGEKLTCAGMLPAGSMRVDPARGCSMDPLTTSPECSACRLR